VVVSLLSGRDFKCGSGYGYKFITVICNGHSPTDTSVRSGVAAMSVIQIHVGTFGHLEGRLN
jgi:hypothetical protein